MEKFFTYTLRYGNRIQRIGKTHCYFKSKDEARYVLNARYGKAFPWNSFEIDWHSTEAAALKQERIKMARYRACHNGYDPPYNFCDGGGGRQIFYMCKDFKRDGTPCRNGALEGNYGFCGNHR